MIRRFACLSSALILFSFAPLCAQHPAPTPVSSNNSLAQRLGYPADSRLLIIHADDFGMMHTVVRDRRGSRETLDHFR